MDADDAVDILDNVSEEERQALISHMEKDAKDDVCLIYSYDDDEIGSKMTTNFICINNKLTIKEAMKELVAQAEEMITSIQYMWLMIITYIMVQ